MRIFISYRHSPAVAAEANLLRDRLAQQLGATVFLDSDGLAVGDEFPAVLERELRGCKVFLALIDPHWLASAERLHEPADWVRRELASALARHRDDGLRVVPVLLQGAAMPQAVQLPPALAGLADLHALPLRAPTLTDDIAALAQRLDGWSVERMLLWLRARRQASVLVALATLVFFSASLMALFDALTLDTRFEALTLAAAEALHEPVSDPRLATVAIDPTSVQRIGRPFDRSWRQEHAGLIRALAGAGAAAVVFDVYLAQPGAQDAALVRAAEQARAGGTAVVFGLGRAGAPPVLATAAIDYGLLCLGTALDLARLAPVAVRRPQPAGTGLETYLVGLGARAVAPRAVVREIDRGQRRVLATAGEGGAPLRWAYARDERVQGEQSCAALLPGDEVAQRIVRLSGLAQLRAPGRRFRYEDLCCQPLPAATAAALRGRIVLVGSELEARDLRQVFSGRGPEDRHGYEIHADVVNNLLQGVDIQPLSGGLQFLVMLAMGALGLALRFWRAAWSRGARRSLLVGVPLLYALVAAWLCADAQLLLNGVYHLAAFFFAHWVSGRLLHRHGLATEPRT